MEVDENVIVDELTKKKVGTWKRLAIFFFDSILMAGACIGLFYSLGTLSIKGIANGSITTINEIYKTECEKRDVPYKAEGIYGLYQLDKNAYIAKILPSMSSYEAAMEKYNTVYYEIDSSIQKYDGYSQAYNGFAGTYYGTLLVSMLIPTFVGLFLIPLLNKHNKTLGMFITKTSLVLDENNVLCSKTRILARFFSVYGIEVALGYVVGQWIGLGFVAIVNVICICFSKKKKAVHDFLTKVHVEKDEYTYTG